MANTRYRRGVASIAALIGAELFLATAAFAQQIGGAASPAAGTSAAPPAMAPATTTAVPAATGSLPSIPAANLPHDLSPWAMFMQADLVVKGVMIGLAFASVVTWTVWLAKTIELMIAKRRVRQLLEVLESAQSVPEAAERAGNGPETLLIGGVVAELRVSHDLPKDGIKERAESRLHRMEAKIGRAIAQGTGLLATIGATAPFVGLFGTVWGIMNSFIGISKAQTTNLAVVAPGIAEALLATAIGLVAAIPAVIIYNVFTRSIAGYRLTVADASASAMRLLSRDLDRRSGGSIAPLRRAAE